MRAPKDPTTARIANADSASKCELAKIPSVRPGNSCAIQYSLQDNKSIVGEQTLIFGRDGESCKYHGVPTFNGPFPNTPTDKENTG